MDWNDDELGDHLDDADGSYFEQAGGDLADISDQDIEKGKDVGIYLGVTEQAFADLEPEAQDEELEHDPDSVGDGEGTSGDEGGAVDEQWEKEKEPDIEALDGLVLDDALASQLEGSLNTNEMMALVEEARVHYGVRLVEINGRLKPFGEPADVQLWLRHVRQGRRHWSKDRRTTVAPLSNSREYQVRDAQKAAEKSDRDRIRYRKRKAEGALTRKPASQKTVEEKCHDHCLYKVREARKTPAFRQCRDPDEVEAFEARIYDEAKVAYMAKLLSKEIAAAQKEERKARARGVKSIMAQRGCSRNHANRLWKGMEERVEELLEIIQKGPNAYNTQVEIDQYAKELAETLAAMREHSA